MGTFYMGHYHRAYWYNQPLAISHRYNMKNNPYFFVLSGAICGYILRKCNIRHDAPLDTYGTSSSPGDAKMLVDVAIDVSDGLIMISD